ncbi:hypothetical protein OC846_003567 [Tilletia horrida]|uniref:FMN hydroxy acid dehydrogenase domain-containing protein n=1 Tax=Tilletia horrida TaxID=155126 RepID=A0AAN6GP91_9BASI|nr:hypothetical protein OC845_003839 [Tilletia horrida]KAK0550710.1 hypothetical protein OC846_003567 [Tilletia horrida]KAK0565965.1 hypothetical protein OC861_003479 [Tilletia horrida]
MNPNSAKPSVWARYRRECFLSAHQGSGQIPPFNTDPAELERLAKERLSEGGWLYASSNAGLSETDAANRAAFRQWEIVPRMLVRESTNETRNTSTTIFGKKISAPIGFAPIGLNAIYNQGAERPVARVAGELGLPYSLSTAGSTSIEEVAKENVAGARKGVSNDLGAVDSEGIRFFQLYLPHNRKIAKSLLQRAAQSGYDAVLLTTDTWQLAWRHHDVANSNYAPYRGVGVDLGLSDPAFQEYCRDSLGFEVSQDPVRASTVWIDECVWHGQSFGWEDAEWARDLWKELSGGKPFGIKGIQSVADAQKCVDHGFDAIVVTNHAGRQVDGAIGSLTALPDIVDAVGEKLTVMFDSGVRGGADVFKALALGAKLVFVGRLWVYGLSIQGETGVRHVLRSLLADFDILMNVAGFPNIKSIDRSALQPAGQNKALAAALTASAASKL